MKSKSVRYLVQDYISKVVYDGWGSDCVVSDIELELEFGAPFDREDGQLVSRIFSEGYAGDDCLYDLHSKLGTPEANRLISLWSEDV